MKVCPRCGKLKYYVQFYRAPSRPSGLRSYCIPCDQAYNRPKVLAIIKKRYKEDLTFKRKRKEYSKEWVKKNPLRNSVTQRRLYEENKEKRLEQNKKQYYKNREHWLEYFRQRHIRMNLTP